VPAHLSAKGSHPSAVLQLGGRQHPSADLHHAGRDGQSKFLHVFVVVEIGAPHQIINFPFAIRCRSTINEKNLSRT